MAAQPTTEIEIHSPTVCIVTLRGEHDVASSDAIALALTLARRSTNVLVDLGDCAFVDSSVISVLLLGAKRMREYGGRLELVVPVEATAVRRTLEISNVQGSLPFHATRADGIAGLTQASPALAEVTLVRAQIAADVPLDHLAEAEGERWAA